MANLTFKADCAKAAQRLNSTLGTHAITSQQYVKARFPFSSFLLCVSLCHVSYHTQSMTPKDFHIGMEFLCGGKRWRCTDVGSRVIVAISLEAHEVVSSEQDPSDPTKRIERRYMSSDPILFDGPPYGIVEHVFDEDSLETCSLTPDE